MHAIALACSKQGERSMPCSSVEDGGYFCSHARVDCYTGWRCLATTTCAIRAPTTSGFAHAKADR
jgi:hypothetical protein